MAIDQNEKIQTNKQRQVVRLIVFDILVVKSTPENPPEMISNSKCSTEYKTDYYMHVPYILIPIERHTLRAFWNNVRENDFGVSANWYSWELILCLNYDRPLLFQIRFFPSLFSGILRNRNSSLKFEAKFTVPFEMNFSSEKNTRRNAFLPWNPNCGQNSSHS